MKLASKVFILIATVLSAISGVFHAYFSVIYIIGALSPENLAPEKMTFGIISAMFFIYSVVSFVLGIVAISKLSKAKCKADIPIALGIFILILNSNVGGILMLCLKDEHFMPKELVEFKKLLDDGIITQEEYDAKAAQLSK